MTEENNGGNGARWKRPLLIVALCLGAAIALPSVFSMTGQSVGGDGGCEGTELGDGAGLETKSGALSTGTYDRRKLARAWWCARHDQGDTTLTDCWPTSKMGDATGKVLTPNDWTVNKGLGFSKAETLSAGHWACEATIEGNGPGQLASEVECEISTVALAKAMAWLCQFDHACWPSGLLGDLTGEKANPVDFLVARSKEEVLALGDYACVWEGNGAVIQSCSRTVVDTFTGFGSGYCAENFESRSAATAGECAELCRATPFCRVFSFSDEAADGDCRISRCSSDGSCPDDRQCTVGTDAGLNAKNSLYGVDLLTEKRCESPGVESNEARTQCVLACSSRALSKSEVKTNVISESFESSAIGAGPPEYLTTGKVGEAWVCFDWGQMNSWYCYQTYHRGESTGLVLIPSEWVAKTPEEVKASGDLACFAPGWGQPVTCERGEPTKGWTVVEQSGCSERANEQCFRRISSGDLGDGEGRWLEYDAGRLEVPHEIGFSWGVSSESGFDALRFSINGEVKATISGEHPDLVHRSFEALAGQRKVFRWEYSKDSSVSSGQDMGFVDGIDFRPVGFEKVCEETDYCSVYHETPGPGEQTKLRSSQCGPETGLNPSGTACVSTVSEPGADAPSCGAVGESHCASLGLVRSDDGNSCELADDFTSYVRDLEARGANFDPGTQWDFCPADDCWMIYQAIGKMRLTCKRRLRPWACKDGQCGGEITWSYTHKHTSDVAFDWRPVEWNRAKTRGSDLDMNLLFGVPFRPALDPGRICPSPYLPKVADPCGEGSACLLDKAHCEPPGSCQNGKCYLEMDPQRRKCVLGQEYKAYLNSFVDDRVNWDFDASQDCKVYFKALPPQGRPPIEAVYEVYCNRDLSAEELNGLGTIRQTDASARKANLDWEWELNNVNEKNLKGTPHPEMNKYFNGIVPRFAPGQ